MMTRFRAPFASRSTATARLALTLGAAAPFLTAGALAQEEAEEAQDQVTSAVETEQPVIAEALAAVSEDVRVFNDHLTILASPWMEGRLPGTRGMELAKEYMEFQFRQSGLVAPLPLEVENPDGTMSIQANGSFRQSFNLGSTNEIEDAALRFAGGDAALSFEHGVDADYSVTSLGAGGEVAAPAVFVGYAIDEGPDGYTSFGDDVDLNGKVAVMLRFEPMDAGGTSLWKEGRQRWSRRAGFNVKLKAVAERGAVGVVIINTPGADDPRVDTLLTAGGGGRPSFQFPVLHVSAPAGERLVQAGISETQTLAQLRDAANAGAVVHEMSGSVEITATIVRKPIVAENVIGMLPGKGRLADQYIVVGAHLDHLGQGAFGSRDDEYRGRRLHPGADDNASGSAGIILIADKMARVYREAGDDANLRSVLFMGFSAEESGLNGSAYYANNPIFPIEKHVLMMNFDMIGRMKDRRLSLSGAKTGAGLAEFLEPHVAASPLNVIQPERMSGASDHTSFERKEIPVLFAIIADLHADYHTSRDVSSLINRVDAVHASNLFYEIALDAAQRAEAFPYVDTRAASRRAREQRQRERAARREEEVEGRRQSTVRVQFGIRPNYEAEAQGVTIEGITADSPAAKAGLMKNDRLIGWNDEKIEDAAGFSGQLRKSKPGDKVTVVVVRGDQTLEVEVTLVARGRVGD